MITIEKNITGTYIMTFVISVNDEKVVTRLLQPLGCLLGLNPKDDFFIEVTVATTNSSDVQEVIELLDKYNIYTARRVIKW